MLVLLMPLEVRRSLNAASRRRFPDVYAIETASPPETHRLQPDPASRLQGISRCENPFVPEAELEDFGSGLTPVTEGWFVVNVRDAEWWFSEGRGARCAF